MSLFEPGQEAVPSGTRKVYIGIDCGKKGALGVICYPGMQAYAKHVPIEHVVVRGKRRDEYDLQEIWRLVSGLGQLLRQSGVPVLAAVESQKGFKGEGPTALLSTGMGYGIWRMALVAAGIPAVAVLPQEWRPKYLPPGSDKQAARCLAGELFPGVAFPLVKDEARAESLLIADYILRKDQGLGFLRGSSKRR